jgi:hypothetical protein
MLADGRLERVHFFMKILTVDDSLGVLVFCRGPDPRRSGFQPCADFNCEIIPT